MKVSAAKERMQRVDRTKRGGSEVTDLGQEGIRSRGRVGEAGKEGERKQGMGKKIGTQGKRFFKMSYEDKSASQKGKPERSTEGKKMKNFREAMSFWGGKVPW